jgi:hypothetical protein
MGNHGRCPERRNALASCLRMWITTWMEGEWRWFFTHLCGSPILGKSCCNHVGFVSDHYWLVVDLALWQMMEFVSWDDDIPNWMENKKCSKPPTRIR